MERVPRPGLCSTCQTASNRARDDRRGDDKAFYDSPAWRRLRKRVLLEEPICRICRARASTVGEHILPRSERPDLELVRENIQGACASCANRKTAMQDGGFSNPVRRQG